MPPMAIAAQLTLSWNDNSDNETGFTIERRVGTSGNYQQLVSVGSDVTSYADADLFSSTTYCYRVMAFNPAGNSSYSNENCATTSASSTPPPATAPPPSRVSWATDIKKFSFL